MLFGGQSVIIKIVEAMRFENAPKLEKKSLPENIEVLESIDKGIKPELKSLAGALRKKGFFLDDDCRIDLEKMKELQPSLYSLQVIERHQKRSITKKRELLENKKRLEKNGEYDKLYLQSVGDVVEKLKTVSFNNFWFKGKFIALRTSLYDDYFNGIDEFILDPDSAPPRVIAAIDETSEKAAWQTKANDLVRKIKRPDLIKIDYGALARNSFGGLKIEYRELKNVPILILAFRQNERDILKWYQAIKGKDKGYLSRLLDDQVEKIKAQCKVFSTIDGISPKLEEQYRDLLNFFQNL